MDFLTFETFISVPLLIAVYYLGVFFLPIMIFVWRRELLVYFRAAQEQTDMGRVKLWSFAALFLVLFQLLWRMMFETIIGYFQMRDYLQQLAG